MKTTQLETAHAEMCYEMTDNEFGMDLPVSIPCGLSCDPSATLDVDAFETELDGKEMGTLDLHTSHNDDNDRWFLDCEIYVRESHKRIKMKCWPDAARVYPREDGPTLGELAQITSAIEAAFETTLHHDPIQ